MEPGKILTGLMFLTIGGINVVKPSVFIDYQKWVSKKLYGAEYKPSVKTYKIQKLLGVIFVLIGFSVLIF